MADWQNAKVKQLVWWNERLFSLKLSAEIDPFTAGQFTKLAMTVDGKRIARAYSFVNSPSCQDLEFFLIKVDDGLLSPPLANLNEGDSLEIATKPSGFFTMQEVPSAPRIWLLATGTAVGPFISMLRAKDIWQKYDDIVLVHAVRQVADLAYSDELTNLSENNQCFTYVPIVSREQTSDFLSGRIPQLLSSSQLPAHLDRALTPSDQFMICGNPDMVKETTNVLQTLGYERNRRRAPGQITVEQYW